MKRKPEVTKERKLNDGLARLPRGWRPGAGNRALEKPKPAKAVFAYRPTIRSVEDIDEHVFFGMAGQIAGENFYKFLFVIKIGVHKAVAHIEPMGPFGAVESNPVVGTVRTELVKPHFVLRDTRLNFLDRKTLSRGDRWKQQCK
jgi:hypothetical protein